MDSLEVFEFKGSIRNYIDSQRENIPLMVQTMVLREILNDLDTELQSELFELVKQREIKEKESN